MGPCIDVSMRSACSSPSLFGDPLQTLENGTRLAVDAVDAGKAGLAQTDPATSSEPQSRTRLPSADC